ERDAIRVDDSAEEAASEIVTTKRLGRAGPAQSEIPRDIRGTTERQHRCEQRGDREHAHDSETGERQPRARPRSSWGAPDTAPHAPQRSDAPRRSRGAPRA